MSRNKFFIQFCQTYGEFVRLFSYYFLWNIISFFTADWEQKGIRYWYLIFIFTKRNHSSRMRTARLLRASIASRCQIRYGGPQVNKFEQVPSLDHQMPQRWGLGPCTERTRALYRGGCLYGEVQCIMVDGYMSPSVLVCWCGVMRISPMHRKCSTVLLWFFFLTNYRVIVSCILHVNM